MDYLQYRMVCMINCRGVAMFNVQGIEGASIFLDASLFAWRLNLLPNRPDECYLDTLSPLTIAHGVLIGWED